MNWPFGKKKEQAPDVPLPQDDLPVPPPVEHFTELPAQEQVELPDLPDLPSVGEQQEEKKVIPPAPQVPETPPIQPPQPEVPEVALPEEPKQKDQFMTTTDYESILQSVSTMEARLKASREMYDELLTLKESNEKTLDNWRIALEDMERKLLYVDKTLFSQTP